jgi:tripartite-type tricarboxylate transporter receptor subunit TctC
MAAIALALLAPGPVAAQQQSGGAYADRPVRLIVTVTHISHKGAVQIMPDLLARQIDVIYTTTVSSELQIRAGRVRGIAVASMRRVGLLPDGGSPQAFDVVKEQAARI